MNVYDFDGTIYDGDSSIDYFLFCLKKNRGMITKVSNIVWKGVLYKIGYITKQEFKSIFFGVICKHTSWENDLQQFWEEKQYKIKKFYYENAQPEDVIISATPEIILKPICNKLGIKYLIASVIDGKTGEFLGQNCYGNEKVQRFFQYFPQGNIEDFFSDSLSDKPMAEIAQRAFLVKKNKISPWPIETKFSREEA